VPDILKQLLTGKDGQTHDLARWAWLISLLAVVAGSAWNAFHQVTFSLTDFAQASAVIAGAHGVAIYAKRDTEPTETNTNK